MKSKSVCDAAGNPISICLKPILHNRLNILFFLSSPIGSIRAWFPSRRSTEHQIGAFSITFEGHDLFALLTGLYGLYFLFVLSI